LHSFASWRFSFASSRMPFDGMPIQTRPIFVFS